MARGMQGWHSGESARLPLRSDEGLTLETSAFRISVRWPIYIINFVDKTKFLYTTSPPTQHHSFFRNYPFLLPPMWPGFDSQTWRHMWVEFVGSLLCTERFSPGTPVFPSPQKPTFDRPNLP